MRPLIINMNGKHTLPYPRGSVWWRTWKMLNDVADTPRAEFCRSFDRIDLSPTVAPNNVKAKATVKKLMKGLAGREVIILGRRTHMALGLPTAPMLKWVTTDDIRWCWVPHPSWMGIEYSEIGVRLGVGYRLESMMQT